MWVLWINLGSSGRAASALQTISQASHLRFSVWPTRPFKVWMLWQEHVVLNSCWPHSAPMMLFLHLCSVMLSALPAEWPSTVVCVFWMDESLCLLASSMLIIVSQCSHCVCSVIVRRPCHIVSPWEKLSLHLVLYMLSSTGAQMVYRVQFIWGVYHLARGVGWGLRFSSWDNFWCVSWTGLRLQASLRFEFLLAQPLLRAGILDMITTPRSHL